MGEPWRCLSDRSPRPSSARSQRMHRSALCAACGLITCSSSSAAASAPLSPSNGVSVAPLTGASSAWRPWFAQLLVAAVCVFLLTLSFLEFRARKRRQLEAKLHRLSKNRRFYMMRHYILREDFSFPPVLDLLPAEYSYAAAGAPLPLTTASGTDLQGIVESPFARAPLEFGLGSPVPGLIGLHVDKVPHPSHAGLFVMNLRHPSRRDSRNPTNRVTLSSMDS